MELQNLYNIVDTKSAQELEVFLTMPRERLRLGCGLQCTEAMVPLGVNQFFFFEPQPQHARSSGGLKMSIVL